MDIEPGFTTSLLNTLSSQRASLTSWLDSEKSRIDSLANELEHAHATESEHIEELMRRLDEVRVQRGLASDDSGEKDKGGGVAQQKRDLEEKQARLEAHVEELRGKNRVGEDRLSGTWTSYALLFA
jgi:uncharacterized protein YicC (UPF0701 family)